LSYRIRIANISLLFIRKDVKITEIAMGDIKRLKTFYNVKETVSRDFRQSGFFANRFPLGPRLPLWNSYELFFELAEKFEFEYWSSAIPPTAKIFFWSRPIFTVLFERYYVRKITYERFFDRLFFQVIQHGSKIWPIDAALCNFYPALCNIALDHGPTQCGIARDQGSAQCGVSRDHDPALCSFAQDLLTNTKQKSRAMHA
jgi:hypothetical protein